LTLYRVDDKINPVVAKQERPVGDHSCSALKNDSVKETDFVFGIEGAEFTKSSSESS